MQPEENIKEIKNAMLNHFEDDKDSFQKIEQAFEKLFRELKTNTQTCISLGKSIEALSKDSQPVNEWFKNINFAKRAFLWVLGVIGTIVAIMLGVKQFLGK